MRKEDVSLVILFNLIDYTDGALSLINESQPKDERKVFRTRCWPVPSATHAPMGIHEALWHRGVNA